MRVTLMVAQYVARVIARYLVMTTNLWVPSCDQESALACMRVLLQTWEWWCDTLTWCKLIKFIVRPKVFFEHAQNTLLVARTWAKCLINCDSSCVHKRVALATMISFQSHMVAYTRAPIVTDPLGSECIREQCSPLRRLILLKCRLWLLLLRLK